MAGTHRFSSTEFIQSGSVAQFLDGIEVTGNVNVDGIISATSFVDANGNPIGTGGGGTIQEFFAGTAAGINSDTPQSLDHFITLNPTNYESEESNTILSQTSANTDLVITTIGSATFTPNYYNFIKIGDQNEPAVTVQQGSTNTYTPTSVEERTAGTHRYIIYAADTNAPGETHRVFHTVTIDAFSNNPPVIKPDDGTSFSIKPNHDENTATLTIDSSNSSDPDNEAGLGEDFITKYTAKRTTSAGGTLNSNLDSYNISLTHPTDDSITETTIDGVPGIEVINNSFPGLSLGGNPNGMKFTIDLSNYNAIDGVNNTIKDSTDQTETYTAEVQDAYNATDEGTYTLTVSPPDIAVISSIKVKFEGGDNDGGFTNTLAEAHTHTLLYNEGSDSSSLLDTSGFDERYRSSCVRIKVEANVNEPDSFTAISPTHTTRLKIMSSSEESAGNGVIDSNVETLGYFEMSNFDGTGFATKFNNTAIDDEYSDLNETNGFHTLTGNGIPPSNDSITYYFGASTNNSDLNTTDHTRHGTHNHHQANTENPISLTINKCPDVLIENIDLEVEEVYNSNTSTSTTHTRNLLYGLNSTILNSEFLTYFPGTFNLDYFQQSQLRVRLKAKITEPFGPAHNQINATIIAVKDDGTEITVDPVIQLTKEFSNQNLTIDTLTSDYTTDHNHTSLNNKELLVSDYTSGLYEIVLPAGTYTLSASFSDFNNVLTDKGINMDIDPINNTSTIIINPVANTTLTNVVTEVETFGYSNEGTTNSTRTVLYGDDRQTNANSSSFDGHDLVAKYSSHSVSRFRVKGTITEPPGPAVSTFDIQIQEGGSNIGSPITINPNSPITDEASSTGLISASLTTIDGSDNRVTEFVTSWVNGEHSLNVAQDSSTSYTIESNFTYNFDNYAEYTTNGFDDSAAKTNTDLEVFDTPKTQISITNIEIETEGDSGVAASPNNSTSDFTDHQRTILFAESLTRPNSDGLPASVIPTAVLKTRVQAVITEPVGPLHHPTSMSVKYDVEPDVTANVGNFDGPEMLFGTSSDDMEVKTTEYIVGGEDDGKLQTTYTSIFTGSEIGPNTYELHLFNGNVTHTSESNGFTKNNDFFSNGNLTYIRINEPTPLSLTNLDVILNKTDAQILHGKSTTETNLTTNATYNATSQNELVQVQITATLEEPLVGNATALVTITGQDSSAPITFTLEPGGADVESESTSGGSTNYTSIEKPIQFAAADGPSPSSTSDSLNVTPPVTHPFTVTATLTNILEVTEGLTAESDTVTINITGAPNSTVSTTLLADGNNSSDSFSSSVFESSDPTASLYYVYPPGTSTGYKGNTRTLDVSQDTSVTAPTLTSVDPITYADGNVSIEYSEAGADSSYFSISPTTITHPTQKSTLTIDRPNREIPYTNEIRRSLVTVTATDLLQGNGKDKSTREIFVIPATPDSMSRFDNTDKKEFQEATHLTFPHQLDNIGVSFPYLHTGLLSLGNSNYENDPVQGDSSTAVKQEVDYIIHTHDGTSNDYSIQLDTHYSPAYTGHYQTPNRAFAFGDQGQIFSRINFYGGQHSRITEYVNLSNEFDIEEKEGNQSSFPFTTSETALGGLTLTVNKVAPFNSVFQNISAYGIDFPNGFQAFDATVNVTSKVQDGYNEVELIHELVDPSHTLNMEPFKFYYDDTNPNTNASLNASTEISHSMGENITEPTFSLSGVSYFKKDIAFNASIVGITDLVGKVYPHNAAIAFTEKIESASGGTITITGDGQSSNGSGQLLHDVYDTTSDTNRRGLRFATGDTHLIPTEGTTTNIHTVVEATTLLANNVIDPSQGQNFTLKYVQNKRTDNSTIHGDPTNWTREVEIARRSIGRFMYEPENVSGYQASTNSVRYFYDELYRWRPTIMLITSPIDETHTGTNRSAFASFTENDFGTPTAYSDYWLSTTFADFSSSYSIHARSDLQQTTDGRLIYPSQSYANVNPNSVDYSDALGTSEGILGDITFNRMYATALQADNFGGGTLTLLLKVYGNFEESDILGSGTIDSKNIRIDIKTPGPTSENGSGWSNPLFNTSNLNTAATTMPSDGNEYNGNGWKSFLNFSDGRVRNQLDTADPHVQFLINLQDRYINEVDGVLLIQIRLKDHDLSGGDTSIFISRLELSAED